MTYVPNHQFPRYVKFYIPNITLSSRSTNSAKIGHTFSTHTTISLNSVSAFSSITTPIRLIEKQIKIKLYGQQILTECQSILHCSPNLYLT